MLVTNKKEELFVRRIGMTIRLGFTQGAFVPLRYMQNQGPHLCKEGQGRVWQVAGKDMPVWPLQSMYNLK
jgi:hypothetical protein